MSIKLYIKQKKMAGTKWSLPKSKVPFTMKHIFLSLFLLISQPALCNTIEVGVPIKDGKTAEAPDSVKWSPKTKKQASNSGIKAKAQDYLQAFKILRLQNPTSKIYFVVGGISIDHVVDFRIMPNGTLGIISFHSSRGRQSKIIDIATISELGIR